VLRDVGSRRRSRKQARPGRARGGALRRLYVKRELPLYTAQRKELVEAAKEMGAKAPKSSLLFSAAVAPVILVLSITFLFLQTH